jgi:Rrf2 family protein
MNVTLKTEYALRALHEVMKSKDGKPVNRKQIAKNQGVSEHFLEKIFIQLQKTGIIRSVRGPGGGFVLNRKPRDITLWDVFTAVDDPDYSEERCYYKSSAGCGRKESCRVKYIWYKFSSTLKENMSSITLMEMA